MNELKHLFPSKTANTEPYVYPRIVVGGEFRTPPRDDRVQHGTQLVQQIRAAERAAQKTPVPEASEQKSRGIALDFSSDADFKLQLQSLEMRQSGIELCNSRIVENVMHATVFVPEGKIGLFVRKFEAYANKDKDTPKGKPRNKALVESIAKVKLAAIESYWTDAGDFPGNLDEPIWWEVWLREKTHPHDVAEQFRETAQMVGIIVSPRELRLPERRVLLAQASVNQWTAFEGLFDLLAELRLAKTLASEFVELPPRQQADLIEKTRARIQPPPDDAPTVCHLDTGVNRSHPLLELAMSEEQVLSCDPNWSVTDWRGHGTEMAGLALYGCLTSLLGSHAPLTLRHRLESVKILPDHGQNDPELYGDITNQGIARIEIVRPGSERAFCLTVTSDGRDEGFPSSWTGALDQTCAGADDDLRRLIIVSAGNTPPDSRHQYPDSNHVHGVQDPAQAWNALTVGAYTEQALIQESGYDGWQPIAEPGRLSPASRTSLIWRNKTWPLKPDIVMEGGNLAIDPNTGRADYVDDLMLLTTRVSPDGALFTTTGDTSAATALASRYAAIIWGHYPKLWPETIRGLLIHSARWTDRMLDEFPKKQRHSRLRCYGFGVPNLSKALWSASNAATLIVEDSLQPYAQSESEIKTKDMHLHRLPWPNQVLESLGEIEVRMRVTLSYFIEPSPGRRGWTRKHRYQSHGLRFAVKRPTDTDDDFRKRISKAARDEDDEEIDQGSDEREWELGEWLRHKGSVHSDTWSGTAADLAACGTLAVFPVTGWWRERKHLGRWNRQARYSLIVSIETPSTDVDLYTPIANEIGVAVQIDNET